jgi:hypothetical protein
MRTKDHRSVQESRGASRHQGGSERIRASFVRPNSSRRRQATRANPGVIAWPAILSVVLLVGVLAGR